MEYFVVEEGLEKQAQINRNKLSDIRISKVTRTLAENGSNIVLPFKGCDFPLVSDLDYSSFSLQVTKQLYFDDLPKSIKYIVMKAEQIQVLSASFDKYLCSKGIEKSKFKSLNAEEKRDVMYDWLFLNKMDIGTLQL